MLFFLLLFSSLVFELFVGGLQPEKVKFYLRLGQSKPIYNAFKAIQDSPDWKTLSEAQKRIVESESSNFVLSSECWAECQ